MAKCGEMGKWRNGKMAKWRNGNVAIWENGELGTGEMEMAKWEDTVKTPQLHSVNHYPAIIYCYI
jgi:hypothetical protein